MLNKTYEWLRIAYAHPTDEVVRKRQLACTDLLGKLEEAEDITPLAECVAGVINGFDNGSTKGSEAVETIISCIRDHQPAFASDLSDNALELRACAMITLGELITRNDEEPSDIAVLTSLLLISSTGLRPTVQERHLKIALDELLKSARSAATRAAVLRRERVELDFEALNEVTAGGDTASLLKSLRPALKQLLKQLDQQAAADREELQVLSWLYNNYAETVGKPIAGLDPFEAALCCGLEIADLVSVPPLEGARQMVADAASKNRKRTGLKKITLAEVMGKLSHESKQGILPIDRIVRKLAQRYASLFPISWVCLRINDSGSPTGWEEEFRNKVGFAATESYSPEEIAGQVFSERIAQRKCEEFGDAE